MKQSILITLLSAIIASSFCFCCHAEERELLEEPGFGGEDYDSPSTQVQEYIDVEDEEGLHVPFQSRIVGGTTVDGSNYPFHVNLGGCGGTL